jgi:hypothetical protein
MPETTIPNRMAVPLRDDAAAEFTEILRQCAEICPDLGQLLDAMLHRRGLR